MEEQARIRHFETVGMRKDGTEISISATISPIINEVGDVIGISRIARDITEHKSLEAQFLQAQKMEAVGRLAGGVAHDFNNILSVVLCYGELLLQEAGPDHPMNDKLAEIKKAAEKAASLTRQLLAYSRKQVLMPDVCDPNSAVKECENMLRRLLDEDIDFKMALSPDLGLVRVYEGQFEQALMNLIINASDAMPQGGKLTIETANATLDEAYCRTYPEVKLVRCFAKAGSHFLTVIAIKPPALEFPKRRGSAKLRSPGCWVESRRVPTSGLSGGWQAWGLRRGNRPWVRLSGCVFS